ncbi:MAG: hypothetical protein GXY03_13320 [Solirubrobacterales bacterium]|nr:hypothetical protein [Solirubrobacterales bacterium]
MTTRATLLAALCALALATGCGDQDGPPSSQPLPTGSTGASVTETSAPVPEAVADVEAEDKRSIALACLRDEAGLEVEAIGDKGIDIAADGDARIDFYQSSLEAEAIQFEGRGEGAMQVGAALFYIGDLPEQQLIDVEECLNEQ